MSTTNPGTCPDPSVMPPYVVRRALRVIFSRDFLASLPSRRLPIPRWLSSLLLLLLLANIKSFPLVWHVRVFAPAVWARLKARPSVHPLLPWIRSARFPTTSPGTSPSLKLSSLPLGRDLFGDVSTACYRAWPDDCDWNGHVSNSCYSKILDYARMAHLSPRFLRFHFDGGWMALGGAALAFHREIPALSKFEVKMNIEAWDDKWCYVVARFVSPAKGGSRSAVGSSKSAQNLRKLLKDAAQPQGKPAVTKLPGEGEGDEGASSPAAAQEEDPLAGRTLYCTAVSRYCFKSGRRTIPPWFVLATSGYGTFASTRANWEKAEALRRQVLSSARAEYKQKHGAPLPRDGAIAGHGHRSAGILTRYDPARPEGSGKEDDRGLGAWQDKSSWALAEFEERRVRGLERLCAVGGVISSPGSTPA